MHSETVTLYPLNNYTFGQKEALKEVDLPIQEELDKLKVEYATKGLKTSIEAVLLVHEHNHPHILLFQKSQNSFQLPGGSLKPGEDELLGLKRLLNSQLLSKPQEWDIGDCLCIWWRPNFEIFEFPYLPAHITKPKEIKKIAFVHLPERQVLAIPKNRKLIAIPLYELFDQSSRYGPVLSALPNLISKFNFVYQ